MLAGWLRVWSANECKVLGRSCGVNACFTRVAAYAWILTPAGSIIQAVTSWCLRLLLCAHEHELSFSTKFIISNLKAVAGKHPTRDAASGPHPEAQFIPALFVGITKFLDCVKLHSFSADCSIHFILLLFITAFFALG